MLTESGGCQHQAQLSRWHRLSVFVPCPRSRRRCSRASEVPLEAPFGEPFFVHLYTKCVGNVKYQSVPLALPDVAGSNELLLRCLEAMLSFHVLHDIPQFLALVNIQSLNFGVRSRPLRVAVHHRWSWRNGCDRVIRPKGQ